MTETTDNIEELKAKFFAVYSNLPLNVRDDIVLVLEDGPITWNVAYIEILSEGNKAEWILKSLAELEFI